jgi:hypothetical protein
MSEPVYLNPDQKLVYRKKKRGFETAIDMVRSMGMVGIAVLLVYLVAWRPAPEQAFQPVNPTEVAQGYAESAGFNLLVPKLPTGWQSNSAWLEPVPNDVTKFHWHIGWVLGDTQYFAIEQSNSELPNWSGSFGLRTEESFTSGDRTWKVLDTEDEATSAYSTELEDSTLVVVGTTGPTFAELVSLVEKQLEN